MCEDSLVYWCQDLKFIMKGNICLTGTNFQPFLYLLLLLLFNLGEIFFNQIKTVLSISLHFIRFIKMNFKYENCSEIIIIIIINCTV